MQSSERPLPTLLLGDVLWTRRDQVAFEHYRVTELPDFFAIQGCVLTTLEDRPYRVDYVVQCDPDWKTRAVHVQTNHGQTARRLELERDDSSRWTRDGERMPEFDGLLDIDLAITPSTNLLPIRRLDLGIGAGAAVEAVWIQFPDFEAERLPQSYRRTGDGTYRYESGGGGFAAELEVDDQGIVTRYGDLWDRVTP
ncbi:MAG: hypothetical protein GEU90_21775 [Gemmatimonas sp.]|nr:hypothetical protein [Gemmatimonas sp.]